MAKPAQRESHAPQTNGVAHEMSSRERKKRKERHQFDKFREVSPVPIPHGETDYDGESPDIVVSSADHRLGIELTTLYHTCGDHGSMAMADAREREGVMAELQRLLVSNKLPFIDVWALFRHDHRSKAGSRKALAERIAHYVQKRIPTVGDQFVSHASTWPIDDELPPELVAIKVTRPACLKRHHCRTPNTSMIPGLGSTHLELCANEKNALVPDYRTRCDEVWLLVSLNTDDLATWFTVDMDRPPMIPTTAFDRVILFSEFNGQACEVCQRVNHEGVCQ